MKPTYVARKSLADESDGDLLRRVVEGRDEAAFECLVARHGQLVMGACIRTLGNRQDAEDAFQAVFLTLASRAQSIRKPEAISGWLYEVAVRISFNVRRKNARWNRVMSDAKDSVTSSSERSSSDAMLELLDEELNRLPPRYRDVLVMCDLQGCSHRDAARSLGVPVSTVTTRVNRGRQKLRESLLRRLPVVTMPLLTATLVEASERVEVPAALVHKTARSAIFLLAGENSPSSGVNARVTDLVHEVMRNFMFAKLKMTVTVIAVLAGLGVILPVFGFSVGSTDSTVLAKEILFDDFEDGSISDSSPVLWNAEQSNLAVQDGSLIVSGAGVPLAVPVLGELSNVSIQVQLRILEGDYAGVSGRRISSGQHRGYFAAVGEFSDNGQIGHDSFLAYNNSLEILDVKNVDFNPKVEDVILQLDIIGNRVTYWAWPANGIRPDQPLGSVIDNTISSGKIFLWASSPGLVGNKNGRAAFRYVRVADAPIVPEPASLSLVAGAPFLIALYLRRRWR